MKQLFVFICLVISFNAYSSIEAFEFDDENQEKRFQSMAAKLRCPTCQNQNLLDSNSIVAEDLKQIVYEKIMAGESDQQIILFMKQRYGEFILYEPEINQSNLILWAGPFIFLVIIFTGFFIWYKKNKSEIDND